MSELPEEIFDLLRSWPGCACYGWFPQVVDTERRDVLIGRLDLLYAHGGARIVTDGELGDLAEISLIGVCEHCGLAAGVVVPRERLGLLREEELVLVLQSNDPEAREMAMRALGRLGEVER